MIEMKQAERETLWADDISAMVDTAFKTVSRNPSDHEIAIAYRRALATQRVKHEAEIEAMRDENSKLAAGVCIYPNGEGLLGDEHGNSFCSVEQERKRLDERETDLMAQLNAAEARLAEAREVASDALHLLNEDIITPQAMNKVGRALAAFIERTAK